MTGGPVQVQVESVPWRDVVPRFAEHSFDVETGAMDEAAFVEEATAIIAAFEERFRPGQPALKQTMASMAAGVIGESPITIKNLSLDEAATDLVDARIPTAYHSGLKWPVLQHERRLPVDNHRRRNATVRLLHSGVKIDRLRQDTSPATIAVGAEEIAALVKQQEHPMLELAALVALKGADIETDLQPESATRAAGVTALITAASQLAVFGFGRKARSDHGLRRIPNLVSVNRVLKAERDELEPPAREAAQSLAEWRSDVTSPDAADRRLGSILDQMFTNGASAAELPA